MRHNVWPMDAQGNRRVGATAPLDNVHNHALRAFAYWAVATHPPQGEAEALMSVPHGQARPPREMRTTPGGLPRRWTRGCRSAANLTARVA